MGERLSRVASIIIPFSSSFLTCDVWFIVNRARIDPFSHITSACTHTQPPPPRVQILESNFCFFTRALLHNTQRIASHEALNESSGSRDLASLTFISIIPGQRNENAPRLNENVCGVVSAR